MKYKDLSILKIYFSFVFLYIIYIPYIPKFINNIRNFKTYPNNKIDNFINFKKYNVSYYKLRNYFIYIRYCMKGILLYKKNLVKSKYPKISVIITVYNRENLINSTLKSVQNQRIKNIEIIAIDDCSVDNSIIYIENSQKIDKRINLIKNRKNMGTLYSKSLGILYAKGKYIIILDSDDMLCIDDYLKYLYIVAKNGNYDYVQSEKSILIHLLNQTITENKNEKMWFCTKLIN